MKANQIAMAVALLVVIAPIGAVAQTGGNIDVALNQIVATDCSTGEPVQVAGRIHFEYTVVTDATTGMNQYNVDAASLVSGVGQVSRSPYSGSAGYSTNFASLDSPSQFTVTLTYALASGGSAPSLVLVQLLNVSVDNAGSISALLANASTECVEQ